jgi:hypothetical protein
VAGIDSVGNPDPNGDCGTNLNADSGNVDADA